MEVSISVIGANTSISTKFLLRISNPLIIPLQIIFLHTVILFVGRIEIGLLFDNRIPTIGMSIVLSRTHIQSRQMLRFAALRSFASNYEQTKLIIRSISFKTTATLSRKEREIVRYVIVNLLKIDDDM